jgi:hypothetical protein
MTDDQTKSNSLSIRLVYTIIHLESHKMNICSSFPVSGSSIL